MDTFTVICADCGARAELEDDRKDQSIKEVWSFCSLGCEVTVGVPDESYGPLDSDPFDREPILAGEIP